jgi:hypothetical protein
MRLFGWQEIISSREIVTIDPIQVVVVLPLQPHLSITSPEEALLLYITAPKPSSKVRALEHGQ